MTSKPVLASRGADSLATVLIDRNPEAGSGPVVAEGDIHSRKLGPDGDGSTT